MVIFNFYSGILKTRDLSKFFGYLTIKTLYQRNFDYD